MTLRFNDMPAPQSPERYKEFGPCRDIFEAIDESSYMQWLWSIKPQHWQFVVWARQLVLLTIASSMNLWLGVASRSEFDSAYRPPGYAGIAISHVLLAMAALAFFYYWHWRQTPYRIQFQNRLESMFFALNIGLLFMSLVPAATLKPTATATARCRGAPLISACRPSLCADVDCGCVRGGR